MSEVFNYHHQTKHLPLRSARSLGYMDWKNQPNPFRIYEGAAAFDLPFRKKTGKNVFDNLFHPAPGGKESPTLAGIAHLLEYSLGLSAWKSYGNDAWSLRMNPSSGNLHPTEAHLVMPSIDSMDAGVYHYDPYHHRLELRRVIPRELSKKLFSPFQGDGFFLILASIYWRESWKYGERAFRYCQHDTGHAMAGIAFAAALSRWRCHAVNGVSDIEMRKLVGFDKTPWPPLEEENPAIVLHIHNSDDRSVRNFPDSVIEEIGALDVHGEPNALSPDRVDWPIIREAAEATRRPVTKDGNIVLPETPLLFPGLSSRDAEEVIRRRRSAQAFDNSGSMKAEVFFDLLDRTIPRAVAAPFDMHLSPTAMHLFIFVHRVEGVKPGLYVLLRNESDREELRQSLSASFTWDPAHDSLPLYLLEDGDFRDMARDLSCRQDIAGDSCFSLAMVGRFHSLVSAQPHLYRQLFWEAGMVGQVLYLTAEAHGFRGTGIGCYFDDAVHELLGLRDAEFQSFYHFTVGQPLDDRRLTTLPAYSHLRDGRVMP
ncbi:MAG: SagB/ThcOx family dehydrogenase [Planctomycetota bacterium]